MRHYLVLLLISILLLLGAGCTKSSEDLNTVPPAAPAQGTAEKPNMDKAKNAPANKPVDGLMTK